MQGSHQLKLKLQALVLLDLKLVKEQVIKTISPKNSDDELIRNKLESNKILKKIKLIINAILTIMGTGESLKGFLSKSRLCVE